MQSGPDEKLWADSMESYTHLRNIQDLLTAGKHHMNGGSANHLKDSNSVWFDGGISPPFLPKTCRDSRCKGSVNA